MSGSHKKFSPSQEFHLTKNEREYMITDELNM